MAKENLRPNQVEAPTLFLGVGGTGSKIVKLVAEMCQTEEKENISFVCMDTNVNDLNSVASSSAKIYYVQTSNTQTVGDYLNYDHDALRNWFPKNAVIYDKTVSEGAGQVRAISRLALNATIKTGKIGRLYDAIDDLFRKDGKEMKQAMRIVMVSTASGGTGSGIILPLAMFLRDYIKNKYPNTSLIVRSLILLPETLDSVINSSAERESQRRNAYATIKEINAFMMKGSGFFDVDEDLKRYSNLHVDFAIPGSEEMKQLALLPFDFCFLLDGQNAEDNTLITLDQYIQQAARALYEQNIGPMQRNAFSVEDNIIKEMSNPGNFGRNRFGGIGAGTLRYPYEDVAKYIAYDWAMDAIGGEGEAAKWGKYDNEYEIKARDARKKGVPESEIPPRSEIYVAKMNDSDDKFTKDLRSFYLADAEARVDEYFAALEEEMAGSVFSDGAISGARGQVNELSKKIDYTQDKHKGKAVTRKENLRSYENAVRARAKKVAQSRVEAIFMNEAHTVVEERAFTLEALLKTKAGKVVHPNAMRYFLYLVKNKMQENLDTIDAELRDRIRPGLLKYAANATEGGTFDVDAMFARATEENLDALCDLEHRGGERATVLEKLGGYDKLYEKLNKCFPAYYKLITEYGEYTAKLETYKFGLDYVSKLCTMLERFYATFPEKVSTLKRNQGDLVEALAFRKGDSVRHVCATAEMMGELSRTTRTVKEDSDMLDSELNGKIFDAVKANVAFEREIQNADVVEDDRRIDIFDKILLGYFCDSVTKNCPNVDMNIIEAIAMENRLMARIKARRQSEGEGTLFDSVTMDDNMRHIQKVLAIGRRLAAPGIQRLRNEEAREVTLCAYNKTLDDMRNYRMGELLKGLSSSSVDTVSRYEIHFFNALYNLTPDKLDKFASPDKSETRSRGAGLYHNAYVTYSRSIGPDSTKNAVISTHIDKRWDSVAVMPEIDFEFQNKQIMKIQKAMIYGLVHGAICFRKLSATTEDKKVYQYENSDERYENLVVSNGTLCDEFFEILDSLYISSSIVEDIDIIRKKKRVHDETRNSNYEDTVFAREVEQFTLECMHKDGRRTSLFEIPLAYYDTLPNSKRYTGEISALVEAVIQVFEDELNRWETGVDVRFLLCSILKDQFHLLMDNFDADDSKGKIPAKDNVVLDIIFRKVRKVIETTPEPSDYISIVDEMRARLK